MRSPLLITLLLLAILAGCNVSETFKLQTIEPGAMTQFPPGSTVTGMEVMEDGQVEYEIILPDGTYQTVSGTGNTGNFTVILNQNDGTDQTSKGQVETDLSPNVGVGGGTAQGGDKAKGDTVQGDSPPQLKPDPVETTE